MLLLANQKGVIFAVMVPLIIICLTITVTDQFIKPRRNVCTINVTCWICKPLHQHTALSLKLVLAFIWLLVVGDCLQCTEKTTNNKLKSAINLAKTAKVTADN